RVAGPGRLGSRERDLGFEADVQGTGLDIAGWPIERANGHVVREASAGAATSIALHLGLLGGRGELTGTLRGGVADARVQLADVDIERLQQQGVAAGFPMQGRLSGDVTAKGDPAAVLDVHGRIRAAGSAYDGPVRVDATATGRVRPRQRSVDL